MHNKVLVEILVSDYALSNSPALSQPKRVVALEALLGHEKKVVVHRAILHAILRLSIFQIEASPTATPSLVKGRVLAWPASTSKMAVVAQRAEMEASSPTWKQSQQRRWTARKPSMEYTPSPPPTDEMPPLRRYNS